MVSNAVYQASSLSSSKYKKADDDARSTYQLRAVADGQTYHVRSVVLRTSISRTISWEVILPGVDERHYLELEHNHITGKRRVLVGGREMESSTHLIDNGSEHRLFVGGIDYVIAIIPAQLSFGYQLRICGVPATKA